MHRTAGSCYKQSIPAENSTARDSSYINEDFRLRIRFVETRLGGFEKKRVVNGEGEKIVPKTEQMRKNVKAQESAGYSGF